MNKIFISLAVATVLVGVVSARRIIPIGEELPLEEGIGYGGLRHGGFGHGLGGVGHSGFGGPRFARRGYNRFSEFGEGGLGGGLGSGFGGGLGEGALIGRGRRFRRGGFRSSGLEGGAIGGGFGAGRESGLIAGERDGFGEAGFAEGERGGIIANKQGLRGSQLNANSNDVGVIHKHNVIDKDTLVVKNNVKAVNDEDGFHAGSSNVNAGSVGAGSENLAALGEEGRLGGSVGSGSVGGVLAGSGSKLGAAGVASAI